MLGIREYLNQAYQQLAASDSPRLDAEVLLAFVLQKPRSHLYAWPEKPLTELQRQHWQALLARRVKGEPVAYLTGEREFYSLPLQVNSHTLIPRPATETLVDQALAIMSTRPPGRCLDLGTGTGAIAIALAHKYAAWQFVAVDQSEPALAVATANAKRLSVGNIVFQRSYLYQQLEGHFDIIISNPPYIDPGDAYLQQGDVCFEPSSALIASNSGLADLEHIIVHAPEYLRPEGHLLLEHGYQQAEAVCGLLAAHAFTRVVTSADVEGHPRVSQGYWGQTNG